MNRCGRGLFYILVATLLITVTHYPVAGQDLPNQGPSPGPTELRLTSLLSQRARPAITLANSDPRLGHSFYPDLWLPGPAPAEWLIVVSLLDPLLVDLSWLESIPPTVGVLVAAPRLDQTDAVSLAQSTWTSIGGSGGGSGAGDSAGSSIYLEHADTAEWQLAAGDQATPRWLAAAVFRAIANTSDPAGIDSGGSRLSRASGDINAAQLGLARPDTQLMLAPEQGQPALRLRAPDGAAAMREIGYLLESAASQQELHSERDYLVATRPGIGVLGERGIAMIVLATGFLIVAGISVFQRRTRRYARALRHNGRSILALFVAFTLINLAANLVSRFVIAQLSERIQPILLGLGRVAMGVLLMSLVFPFLHIRLRRASATYSGASLLMLAIGVAVVGVWSLTLSVYFALTVLAGLLFSLGRSAIWKGLSFALALWPVGHLVASLAAVAHPGLVAALLSPPVWQEPVAAIVLLPLLLMFFRLEALTPKIPLLRLGGIAAAAYLVSLGGVLLLGFVPDRPLQITISELITDSNASVGVSRAPGSALWPGAPRTPDIVVQSSRGERIACATLPCVEPLALQPHPFDVHVARDRALERTVARLSIEFHAVPRAVELHMLGSAPLEVHNSSIPASPSVDIGGQFARTQATEAHFALGPAPPTAVHETIVFSSAEAVELVVRAYFDPGTASVAAVASAASASPAVVEHTVIHETRIGVDVTP